jgi:hypothetical protein
MISFSEPETVADAVNDPQMKIPSSKIPKQQREVQPKWKGSSLAKSCL